MSNPDLDVDALVSRRAVKKPERKLRRCVLRVTDPSHGGRRPDMYVTERNPMYEWYKSRWCYEVVKEWKE